MATLILKRPTRSKKISQHFGENKACITLSGKVISSYKNGRCPDNSRPFYKSIGMEGHSGMDIPGITGEDVVHAATFNGWMKTEKDESGGLGVDVISHDPLFFEGPIPDGLETKATLRVQDGVRGFLCHAKIRYWHLHSQVGHTGKKIRYGQVIGLLGSSGMSSGPHLHWSWKFCDVGGVSYLKYNGFYGAYDPESKQFGVAYDHDLFAGDSVVHLNQQVPLTVQERQDRIALLSLYRRLLLELRELLARL